MIQANELRIGNIIASSANQANKETWVIGKVHSISSIDAKFEQIEVETDESFTWFFKDNYFGIPLTEDWLVKFGFKNEKLNRYRLGKLLIALESDSYKKGRVYYNSWAIKERKPKYVHSLQNLYFALTGKELEIEL